jgi:hypothetical protein
MSAEVAVANCPDREWAARYWALHERHVHSWSEADGVPEANLARCESRLRVRLPVLVRWFYRWFGRCDQLNQAFANLLPPEQIEIRKERVVFYRQHGGAGGWSFLIGDAGKADPPISVSQTSAFDLWYPEHNRTSQFLLLIFFWQYANGGAPFGGMAYARPGLLAAMKKSWKQELAKQPEFGFEVYSKKDVLVCASERDGRLNFDVGSRTEASLRAVRRALKLNWGHAWPDSMADDDDEG